jgi:molecular chaperone HtpG
MKEGQDAIYYITADGFAAARHSPHLEVFRKLGVEVLLLCDRIDELVASVLTTFDGRPLQSVAKGDLDLGTLQEQTDTPEQKHQDDESKDLIARMADALKERASSVRVTHRLTNSPACLVSDEQGMSMNLERLLKASGQRVTGIKPVLEVNPSHPIVERLKQETDASRISDWSHILFDQATLAEGGQLDDPATFVARLNELILALAGAAPSRIWTPGG